MPHLILGYNKKLSEQNFNLFSIKHSSLRYSVNYGEISNYFQEG